MAGRQRQGAMQKTHRENERQEETEIQKGTVGQNQSERGRKVGKARAQEEVKGANEKKTHGKAMYSQNSQAGVDLMRLHFKDVEIAKQGEGHLAQGPRGRSDGGGI